MSACILFLLMLTRPGMNAFSAALQRYEDRSQTVVAEATIVLTTATLGYASGIAGHRLTLAAFILIVLMALVVYLIFDLDRPRRGIIQVSHESLLSLQQTIGAAPGQPTSLLDAPQALRR